MKTAWLVSLLAHASLVAGAWYAWSASPSAEPPKMPILVMRHDTIEPAIAEPLPPADPAPPASVQERFPSLVDDDHAEEVETELVEVVVEVRQDSVDGALTARVREPRKLEASAKQQATPASSPQRVPAGKATNTKTKAKTNAKAGAASKPKPVSKLCDAPRYPRRARDRGLEGRVIVRALVGTDGRVRKVEVTKSSGHAILDRSAVNAVEDWVFTPAQQDGKPSERWYKTALRFTLS